MDILKTGLIAVGALVVLNSFPQVRTGISKAFANPANVMKLASNDPFDLVIEKLKKDHQDFLDTAECRAKLAQERDFWVTEGVSVEKILPAICVKNPNNA